MGLVKGHYFINGYTELTSYCLEHYGEVKDIKGCNNTFKEYNGNYNNCNDICIQAFQVFKILVDSVDKLTAPMELIDGVVNTQF